MRIVITGASGNVGTALLRALAADPDGPHDVTGICRRVPPSAEPYSTARWVSADLAEPESAQALAEAVRGADAVVHLAWLIQPSHKRDYLRKANQDGTQRVIAAALDHKVPHLVHMSSVGTYAPGASQTAVDESWSHDGVRSSQYSVDKAACEAMLDRIEATETAITRVRPALILQPDAASEIRRYFLGPLAPVQLLRPWMLRYAPLPKGMRLQFVHADDVADAYVRILHQRLGGAFNLAAEPIVDRDSWAAAFTKVGPPAPVPLLRAGAWATWHLRLQPTGPGWVDMGKLTPVLDSGRARELLGWAPQHRADDLLVDFVKALRRGDGAASPPLAPRGA